VKQPNITIKWSLHQLLCTFKIYQTNSTNEVCIFPLFRLIKPHLEVQKTLYYLFSVHGRILNIVIVKGRRMRGQAHIVFQEVEHATHAMRLLQSFPVCKRQMVCISFVLSTVCTFPIPLQSHSDDSQRIQMNHSVKLIQTENSVQQDSYNNIKHSSRRNIDATRRRQRNAFETRIKSPFSNNVLLFLKKGSSKQQFLVRWVREQSVSNGSFNAK
jgi:hypothetical protein